MILLIDNYDSFTYNVYQYVGELHPHIEVARNDEITIEEIETMAPEAIIISPGPGYPETAGITNEVIRQFSGRVPILGICLGHQAIGEVFGGKVIPAEELMHGKMSKIFIKNTDPLFDGLEEEIYAARYHSLVVDAESVPDCLEVLGTDEKCRCMAFSSIRNPF